MKAAEPLPKQAEARVAPYRARPVLWVCLFLVASIAAVYWPLGRSGFIHCDDPDYVYQNPQVEAGLTWHGIVWAFTSDHAGNWHPVTWMSHMLDCQLFAVRPGPAHLVNVLFHAANTLLLFLLLRQLTGALWRSALVAALFALHPLHVESVAWISERKDVLSGFFFMLTLLAYGSDKRREDSDKWRVTSDKPGKAAKVTNPPACHSSLVTRHLSLPLFALGLMSKPMLVTVPFVLLLLDFWPLGRARIGGKQNSGVWDPGWRRLLLEKVPFLLLAAASSVLTFIAQRHAGAVMSAQVVPPELRIENAIVSYALYLWKMVWPANLAFAYPYPADIPVEQVALAFTVLLVISYVAIARAKRFPYLLVGWLWYLGMLVPVIGLVQVGNQAMADRYTYLPLIGIFIALVWGGAELINRAQWLARPLVALAGSGVAACALLAASQVRWWHDSEMFFRHTLALTPNNALAHLNLGTALAQEGKLKDAEQQFSEALALAPSYPEAQSNLGFTLAARGDYAEAIPLYRAALASKPYLRGTHFLLGSALTAQGDAAAAIPEYEAELALQPDNDAALNDLAWLRAAAADPQLRNGAEAVALAERACRLTGFKEAQYVGTLAAAYAEAGRFADATAMAEKAMALATATGDKSLAERNSQLLQVYRAGKAYHETKPQ